MPQREMSMSHIHNYIICMHTLLLVLKIDKHEDSTRLCDGIFGFILAAAINLDAGI